MTLLSNLAACQLELKAFDVAEASCRAALAIVQQQEGRWESSGEQSRSVVLKVFRRMALALEGGGDRAGALDAISDALRNAPGGLHDSNTGADFKRIHDAVFSPLRGCVHAFTASVDNKLQADFNPLPWHSYVGKVFLRHLNEVVVWGGRLNPFDLQSDPEMMRIYTSINSGGATLEERWAFAAKVEPKLVPSDVVYRFKYVKQYAASQLPPFLY